MDGLIYITQIAVRKFENDVLLERKVAGSLAGPLFGSVSVSSALQGILFSSNKLEQGSCSNSWMSWSC